MLRTGQSPAPSMRRSSSASTPGSHPTPGVLLPGTLASPRTGLPPAGCRELVARLRRGALLSVLLGARATGRTFRRNRARAADCIGCEYATGCVRAAGAVGVAAPDLWVSVAWIRGRGVRRPCVLGWSPAPALPELRV